MENSNKTQGPAHLPLLSIAEVRLRHDFRELSYQRYFNRDFQLYLSPPFLQGYTHYIPLVLIPATGPYESAAFHCLICVPASYPFRPPWVQVRNRVYHPNVDPETGVVYIQMLKPENWNKALTLHNVLFSIEQVILHPDFSFLPQSQVRVETAALERKIRKSVAGGCDEETGLVYSKDYGGYQTLKRKASETLYPEAKRPKRITETR